MAKKQTLKSLLGASGERVQVSYDPSEITLAPTVQQTRGSGTVVQAMPQTNQVLNFARAFNQVPQVLGQMKNIGQVQAVEDFNQITDDKRKNRLLSGEEEMKRSLMLGYDKAFQEELVKDYFVRNSNDIAKRFTNIADNHTEEDKFNSAMYEEKQAFIGELTEQFGDNPHRVVAINAFGDKIVTEIEGKTRDIFTENIRLGAVGFHATNMKAFIKGNGDIDTAFSNFLSETQTKQLLTKSESKAELLINGMAIANQFAKDGQYDRALEVTQKLKSIEFFKGATYAGDDLNKIVNLEGGIRTAKKNNDSVSTSNVAQQIRGSFSFVSTQLAGVGKGENVSKTTYNQVLGLLEDLRPNLPTEEKLKLMSKFDDESLTDKQKVEMLKTILTEAGTLEFKGEDGETIGVPDNTSTIFNLASQGFVDYYAQEAVLKPWLVNGLTEEQKKRAVVGALDNFKLRNIRPEGWMREIGFPEATPPKSVTDAYIEAHQLDWMGNNKTFEKFDEGVLKTSFESAIQDLNFASGDIAEKATKQWGKFVADNVNLYLPQIEEAIEDYALTIIDEENRDELLTQEIKRLKSYYAQNLGQLFEAQVNSKSYLQFGRMASFTDNPEANRRLGVRPSEFIEDINPDKGKKVLMANSSKERSKGDYEDLDEVTSSERFVEEQIKEIDNPRSKHLAHLTSLNRWMVKEQYAHKNVDYFQESYSKMRSDNDMEALSATMVAYGYPTFDTKSADDLRRTGLSIAEVKLFGSDAEVNEIFNSWKTVFNKWGNKEALTSDEQIIFETIADYGIFDNESFRNFFSIQQDLITRF